MKVWGMRIGMGCEAQTTAIAWLLRGFATTQTAIKKADIPSLSPEEALRLRNAFHFILAAFGIILPEEEREEAPEKVRILADQRWQAKQNRDWTEADRLRAEVAALGWVIKDRKDGYDLARK